jgi:hypothetical protein
MGLGKPRIQGLTVGFIMRSIHPNLVEKKNWFLPNINCFVYNNSFKITPKQNTCRMLFV